MISPHRRTPRKAQLRGNTRTTPSRTPKQTKPRVSHVLRTAILALLLLCIWLQYKVFFRNFGSDDSVIDLHRLEADSSKLGIFYNAYLPEKGDERRVAKEIIAEQVGAMRASPHLKHATFHYSYISMDNSEELGLCSKYFTRKCKRLMREEQGDEVDTLQALYNYCLRNPAQSVLYMHDKGAFHPHTDNTNLRHLHNRALLETSECFRAVTSRTSGCNICSARVSPLPHLHTSGNMWMAKCRYIQQLHPPKEFAEIMDREVVSRVRAKEEDLYYRFFPACRPPRNTSGSRFCEHDSFSGLGRYSSEHWVHSHPSVQPCDVLPPHKEGNKKSFVWGYDNIPNSTSDRWTPDLHRGPRFHLETYEKYGSVYMFDEALWVGLEGRLFEWSYLYNATPSHDSWIWSFYGSRLGKGWSPPLSEMIS